MLSNEVCISVRDSILLTEVFVLLLGVFHNPLVLALAGVCKPVVDLLLVQAGLRHQSALDFFRNVGSLNVVEEALLKQSSGIDVKLLVIVVS